MARPHNSNGYVPLATSADSPPTATSPVTLNLDEGGFLTLEHDGGITYAYGSSGIRGLSSNAFAFSCALLASLGGLTFGYDQGVIANVLVMPFFKRMFHFTAWEVGLVTAVLELGALVGALVFGVAAGERRRAILFASGVFCLGGILQCIAASVTFLAIGRAIGGFGVGALRCVSTFTTVKYPTHASHTVCFVHSTYPRSPLPKSVAPSWPSNNSLSSLASFWVSGQATSLETSPPTGLSDYLLPFKSYLEPSLASAACSYLGALVNVYSAAR